MERSENRRILVIEDDPHIVEGLKLNLSLQGYQVATALDGPSGLQKWREWEPDLIVLDIMLPVIDGLSVLQNIRLENPKLPVLILSAKATPKDRIRGFAAGVDDYMHKPFDLEELLLRVERLLTRVSWQQNEIAQSVPGPHPLPEIYRFGPNRIDFLQSTAQCRAGRIQLTEQEIKLLKVFVLNRGKPLARDKLLEIVWGYTRKMSTRTLDNFMVRLRKYFEEDPKNPVFFKSIRSVGYLFDPGALERSDYPQNT